MTKALGLEMLTNTQVEQFCEHSLRVKRPSKKFINYFFTKFETKNGYRYVARASLTTINTIAVEGNFEELSKQYKAAKDRRDESTMRFIWGKVYEAAHRVAPNIFK